MKQTPLIWMLDDNPMVLNLAEFTIKNEMECKFRKFHSAEDAVFELQHETPDIIVVDYVLSATDKLVMNGLQFLKALKEHGLKIPAIVLSGQDNKEKAAEMLKQGAMDYISKDDTDFAGRLSYAVQEVLGFVQKKQEQVILQSDIRKNLVTAGIGILLFVSFLLMLKQLAG